MQALFLLLLMSIMLTVPIRSFLYADGIYNCRLEMGNWDLIENDTFSQVDRFTLMLVCCCTYWNAVLIFTYLFSERSSCNGWKLDRRIHLFAVTA